MYYNLRYCSSLILSRNNMICYEKHVKPVYGVDDWGNPSPMNAVYTHIHLTQLLNKRSHNC